jgi:uncharacterized tellurite resistance protein B-like protein
MFLNAFNTEEKILFLDMAMHVSKANGLLAESEQHMIDVYCKEMNIASYDKTQLRPVNDITKVFSKSTDEAKRVAVFELLGLGYIDGSFDELEQTIVKDFSKAIGISDEIYNRLNRDVDEYITLIGFIQEHIYDNSNR